HKHQFLFDNEKLSVGSTVHYCPVGMLKMEKVHLHNPGSEEISLMSISGSTAHFHASFFKHAILPPGGMTSFDVVFLARVVGNIENTLFINTSHHGLFAYQVFGVSVPNLYRLRPFTVPQAPVDEPSSPLLNLQPSHSQPLQVVEMYCSGADLHLELPTGQQPHTEDLWVCFQSFGVFSSPAIYSSKEVLDFGTLRAQDRPRTLNLLLNAGAEDVGITSVRTSPSNTAISVEFKGVTLKERGYTKVASITFDPSKAAGPEQSSGKITVKVTERSYPTLEIPYQADVLKGYLSFEDATTLFHIRNSPLDPVVRPIYLTNTFGYPVQILNASLKLDATTMFTVQNLSSVVLPPQGSQYVFSLVFQPVRPSVLINSNVLLHTNLSRFHLPVLAYTGLLETLVLPPSLQDSFLDFGVQSSTKTSSITLVVINGNPIELEIKSWLVTGDSFSMELLKTGRGNQSVVRGCAEELQQAPASQKRMVILASGYYAAFRVSLIDNSLKGTYERAVHITTDYEQGKVVHQGLVIQSSFRQPSELRQVVSLTQDPRFTHRRLRNARTLEPRRRTKVANIYFDAGLQCGDDCYVGLPFILKGESMPGRLVLQEDIWDEDVDLLQKLLGRWNDLVDRSGHEIKAVFEVNSELQANFRSEVVARLTWPSLLNSTHRIVFPLTNANSSSDEEVVLANPADVPVFVQLLPLALFPSPSVFSGKLADRVPWANLSNINIDTKTLEFHVHQHPSSGSGFQGPSPSLVHNMLLQPGESRSFNVRFTPSSNHSVSSLLIVRNNLTVMDVLLLEGHGVREHLRVGKKTQGQDGYLRFKVTEALLRHCTNQTNPKEPNHSLRRSFKVENAGVLPVHVTSAQINRHACGGHGFTVLDCQDFIIQPNSSRELVILFTPDFSASRVIRELRLVTRGGSEFVFVLNASLPHHMLGACAKTLPRPAWEWDFCFWISLVMRWVPLGANTASVSLTRTQFPLQAKTKEQKKKKKKKRKKRKEEKKEQEEVEGEQGEGEEQEGEEQEQEDDAADREKKIRTHGEGLKDLQDDDASSTTTDTSTTDLEAFIRESIFTTSGNTWSTTGPFSNPVWSISQDPTLHNCFTTPSDATPTTQEAPPSPGELSPTYNPWSLWRPMLRRSGSEPWPSPPHDPI
uniref:Transmembrane protein 131 n=1 Tax=Gadus morhua TaxID=8049 RepID=A0A8C4Z016_GADMO